MKINKNKRRNPSMPETQALSVQQTIKKAKVDQISAGRSTSIEVIDLSDSEESTNSSQQEQSINECQVKQKQDEHNYSQTNGTFINQLLQMNGSLVGEEIDIQDNPNQIFFHEDFDLEETNNSASSSEQANEIDENSKFFGISKLVRTRCSTCKMNFEDVNDNQLRFIRKCSKCQSSMLFQCRKCAKFYRYFQSVWDHVKRSCQKVEIAPSILELAIEAENKRYDYEQSAPPVITLDSDDVNEDTVNFVNCNSTLPFRIQSVESGIDMEKNSSNDCPAKTEKPASSRALQTSKQDNVDYQCYKCEFKAGSSREVQRHIVNAHSEDFVKHSKTMCSQCKRFFKTVEMRKQHEDQCCRKFYYNCKFCPLITGGLTSLRKHLVARHSTLFQEHELEGIVSEIDLARKEVQDVKHVGAIERRNGKNSLKDKVEQVASGIEISDNENCGDFSKINELLKIRCCKCKVTFERVEEKAIHYCPNCQAELLYCCRLCNKFFAFFDKAWSHVFHDDCRSARDSIINAQPPQKYSKTPWTPRPTYSCGYCDFTTAHKWQVIQHTEMWHSCVNDDRQINFTACSRCGRAFEKPEDCALHEQLKCGKEMMLVCEFCPRVEDRVEPMRIHLAMMHMKQLGSLSNLENVISSIKMKRQSARGLSALPVPNQQDDYMEMDEG